ncbi:TetR/AcrR family transcriptional regulator [Fructobacillus sp. M1-13]|uniref:TetR/AcrR family transcriptional regulator n=1 Tax=Fructobacillus papyriferae TaxID=2713171 RepID=A0ABS5QRA5_9LACO|nr:TetR/AcrR family transcriptional regulator [Fructobacillus papyriferae]MBS9335452.1 TetR/AcrR family transcriptional regulator [Fructobacillus papyriferae]MCD2159222.1 TetR/AcrR family transcriptional regulator [Fructobacillus papyriferae]
MIKDLFYKLKKDKRKQITQDFYQVFSEKDLLTVSVKDLVLATNISRGSFYTYFDSPRDAYAYVLAQVLQRIHRQLEGQNPFVAARQFLETMTTNPDRAFLKHYYTVNEIILEVHGEAKGSLLEDQALDEWLVSVSVHELIRRYFLNPENRKMILDRLSALEAWSKRS